MKNNKGCVGVLLGLFGGGGNTPQSIPKAKSYPYGLRDEFLSPAEVSFFHVLRGVLGNEHYLVTKVRLEDLFFVRQPHKNRGARNPIAQKHVDFLICEAGTMRPLAGIELDDSSHRNQKAAEKDEFKDAAFKAAGLPLLRVKAARGYVPGEVKEKLAQALRFAE